MEHDSDLVTLKKASKITGASPVAIKRWERIGKLVPARDPITNCRLYRVDDLIKLRRELPEEDIDIEEVDEEIEDS